MLRELLAVTARVALEWAVASLLLANGAAFCLIAAAAKWLRLGPPCILCARVHRLLCSVSASAGDGLDGDALRLLLCDAHLAAVDHRAEPDHRDGAARKGRLTEADDRDKVSGSSSEDGGSGTLVSLFELSPIITQPRGGDSSVPELVTVDDGDERLTVGQIVSLLRDHRRELEALRAELAAERRARAEAEEYQRQLEEQGELDREAARLAMQLVHESETEKHGLQRQLDAYRVKAQLYQSSETAAAMDDGEGGRRREANGGGGDGNNN